MDAREIQAGGKPEQRYPVRERRAWREKGEQVPRRSGLNWVPAADLMLVLRECYLHRPGATIYTLAEESGISAKTIEQWASGDTSFVRFTVADRVLTRAGLTDAWHSSGLRRFYGAGEAA